MKRTHKLWETVSMSQGRPHKRQGKGIISLLHKQLHKTRNASLRRRVPSSGGINETETEACRWPLQSSGFGHLPGTI